MTIHTHGPSPDRAPAPAYRLAPDTPAEIAADLARLCAPAGQDVSAAIAAGDTPAGSAPQSIGRRLALFGAAAALLVPPIARPAAARVPDADADAALIALAAELDRTLDGAAFAFDPVADEDDQDRRLERGNALQLDIAALPAVGLAGVLAKAYLDSNSYDTVNLVELADSLAEDAERVIGGLRP